MNSLALLIFLQAEFKLFNNAVSAGGQWCAPHGQPNFEAMAQWWSSVADGTSIVYKLKEHLATHYRSWMEHQQANRSLVGSEKQRQPNTKRIRSNNHTATVLAAAVRQYPGLLADNMHAAQSGRAGSRAENRAGNREQSRPEGREQRIWK